MVSVDTDGPRMGMLLRISSGNSCGYCTEAEARGELTNPASPEDNRDLVWIPDDDGPALTLDEKGNLP